MKRKDVAQTLISILLQWAPSCRAAWLPELVRPCQPALLCLRCGPHRPWVPFCKQHALTLTMLPHIYTHPPVAE